MNKQNTLERLDFYRDAPAEMQSTIATAARYVKFERVELETVGSMAIFTATNPRTKPSPA